MLYVFVLVRDRYTATDFVRTLGVHSKLSTDDSIYQAVEKVAQIGETNYNNVRKAVNQGITTLATCKRSMRMSYFF